VLIRRRFSAESRYLLSLRNLAFGGRRGHDTRLHTTEVSIEVRVLHRPLGVMTGVGLVCSEVDQEDDGDREVCIDLNVAVVPTLVPVLGDPGFVRDDFVGDGFLHRHRRERVRSGAENVLKRWSAGTSFSRATALLSSHAIYRSRTVPLPGRTASIRRCTFSNSLVSVREGATPRHRSTSSAQPMSSPERRAAAHSSATSCPRSHRRRSSSRSAPPRASRRSSTSSRRCLGSTGPSAATDCLHSEGPMNASMNPSM
jgi:hypothetical protein